MIVKHQNWIQSYKKVTLSHKAFIFAEIVQSQSSVSELRILSSIPSHKNILNWDFKSPHQERHVLFQLYMSHKLSVSLGCLHACTAFETAKLIVSSWGGKE